MAVPYTFGSATTSIPLSQLDSNFATTITLGNTAIQLGNTVTTLNNITLANVTISSGTSNLAATSISNGTSNVTVNSSGGNITLGTAGTTAITVDTSQNVGIGATPNSKLYIRAATDANLRVTDASGTLNLSAENNAGSAQVAMKFNGSQMMLTSAGKLLIGTTTVAGLGTTIGGTQGDNFWISNTSSSSGYNHLQFKINGTDVGVIQTSGSSTSYQTSSDYRLKENITPMTGALAKVAQLKPVTYKWKLDGSDGQGFIAHELQEIVPDCVGGAKDAVDADGNPKYQGIDTSFLVATLTAAIQELKAINDTQAETINALTARIVALEAK